MDIWIRDLEGGTPPELVAGELEAQAYPEFSPDGRWIAYASAESGHWEVYVQSYPLAAGGKMQVSDAGGGQPHWSGDGRELYYRSDHGVMVVGVETDPGALRADRPRLLFEGAFAGDAEGIRLTSVSSASLPGFDAAADGQSFFLMSVDEVPAANVRHVTLVFDWFDELQRSAPPER